MKKNLILALLIVVFSSNCSAQKIKSPPEFPLERGTTWIYSFEAYEPTAFDPNQTIKATYKLTETVVEMKNVLTYTVSHVKREYELINADVGWTGDLTGQPNEVWYVVNDNQVFQSNRPLEVESIQLDELIFDYEFPLPVDKSWCLFPQKPPDSPEITGCDFIGKRMVTKQGDYETPAGSFDDCYDIVDYFNGGNIFQTFCIGIGIASKKFDHVGTRFGFEQTLINYSAGVP